MSNFDINVDRRTDGRKIGRLYCTLLQAGATMILTACYFGMFHSKQDYNNQYEAEYMFYKIEFFE